MSDAATPVPQTANLFGRLMPPGYRDELRVLEAELTRGTTHRGGTILLFQLGELRLALPTRVASAVAPVAWRTARTAAG